MHLATLARPGGGFSSVINGRRLVFWLSRPRLPRFDSRPSHLSVDFAPWGSEFWMGTKVYTHKSRQRKSEKIKSLDSDSPHADLADKLLPHGSYVKSVNTRLPRTLNQTLFYHITG